jgi:GNAT superfamily N-acetyltransferase
MEETGWGNHKIRVANISMCVRDFVLSDLSYLRQMIHNAIDASYAKVYPDRAVQFFKDFHSDQRILERSQKGEILIIESDNVIVATGAVVGNEILGVFVRSEEQEKGYGKTIMNELERRAKTRGFVEITLSISLPSRKFYEALGYEIVGDRSVDVGQGQRLDYWEAQKTIAPKRHLII